MSELKHGSLAGQDLSLLTEASVLLVSFLGEDRIVTFLGVEHNFRATPMIRYDGGCQLARRFTYLGERTPDGTITAPAGGWVSNPVPGRMVEVTLRNGAKMVCKSDDVSWRDQGEYHALVAFSLIEDAKPGRGYEEINPQGSDWMTKSVTPAKPEGEGAPVWHRSDSDRQVMLYTLRQDGWRKGEPVMVNDVTVTIRSDNRSETPIEPVAQTILSTLSTSPQVSAVANMVDRFLSWKLPPTFNPDGGVRFDKEGIHPAHWPTGTNLLDHTQATEMVRHMLAGEEQ